MVVAEHLQHDGPFCHPAVIVPRGATTLVVHRKVQPFGVMAPGQFTAVAGANFSRMEPTLECPGDVRNPFR